MDPGPGAAERKKKVFLVILRVLSRPQKVTELVSTQILLMQFQKFKSPKLVFKGES